MTPEIIAQFVAALQKETLPGIWSKGVAMSRDCPVLEDSRTENEIILRIQVPGRPISPKVTLWPVEGDSYCDCGDRNDPCIHIVAAAIALKTGLTRRDAAEQPNKNRAHIEYRFTRKDGSLGFARLIHQPGAEPRVLTESLISWVGGIHSGRIQAPLIPATKEDFAIDATLGSRKSGVPEREVLEKLLPLLDGASNVSLDGKPIQIESRAVTLTATLEDEANGVRLSIALPESVQETFANGAALQDGKLKPLLVSGLSLADKERYSGAGKFFKQDQLSQLASEILPVLQTKIPLLNHSKQLPELIEGEPRAVLRIQNLPDATISVLPIIIYGKPTFAEIRDGVLVTFPGVRKTPLRNREAEQKLLRSVQNELQLSPTQSTRFAGPSAVDFLLRAEGWEKEGDSTEQLAIRDVLDPSFKIGPDGDIAIHFNSRSSSAEARAVFDAWHAQTPFVRLLDGTWARLPGDWLNRYGEKILSLLEAREKSGKLPKWFLPEAAQLSEELDSETPAVFESIRRALENFSGIPEATLPKDLRAELRAYQKSGINWLSFLIENGMGALLADDMGLGKTVQTLCVLRGRTLVVAPTSVLHSWAGQIEKFRPGLRFQLYHGPQRQLDPEAQITITSYAILRLDKDILGEQKWDTAVLDEAQVIRNPESQIARAAHQIQAKARIALTGTPIENRLDDLWSQFQFLNPGLLGTRSDFLNRYTASPEATSELKNRLRPFVLRRLKREVAPELPSRTESVVVCELSSEERALYDSVLAASRQESLRLLETGGSTFSVLETLLRLRQACCHPGLLPGQTLKHSSKIDLLLEILETSIAEGHRSLVFSQWTSLLDLVEPELRAKNIGFLRLDGSTPDRNAVVSQFQESDGPPVLLLSLKAGGVGLTLTAADHVYLLDPWWNPAVENQAADRAHRIGQDKPVMIYRLAARDTVEEKVLELQQRKLCLAESILARDAGGSGALELTREDLITLLQ